MLNHTARWRGQSFRQQQSLGAATVHGDHSPDDQILPGVAILAIRSQALLWTPPVTHWGWLLLQRLLQLQLLLLATAAATLAGRGELIQEFADHINNSWSSDRLPPCSTGCCCCCDDDDGDDDDISCSTISHRGYSLPQKGYWKKHRRSWSCTGLPLLPYFHEITEMLVAYSKSCREAIYILPECHYWRMLLLTNS